jgi:hypothetical protein
VLFFFCSYVTLVRKPVRLLKAYQYIPSDIDVPASFLSSLREPPPPFDSLSSNDDWNDRSFVDVQLAVLRHYLQWRLEMQPDELDSLVKTYCRLKHRSFRLVEKSLKILEEDIGFTKKRVSSSITVLLLLILLFCVFSVLYFFCYICGFMLAL